jgi:uncharacterized membrane protein
MEVGGTIERSAQNRSSLTRITWVVYWLQVLTLITGFADIIGVIINYAKKSDAMKDPLMNAHFRWQIRTFWFSLLWVAAGFTAFVVGGGITATGAALNLAAMIVGVFLAVVGLAAILFSVIWYLYRFIRGMIALNDNKSPKPGYRGYPTD